MQIKYETDLSTTKENIASVIKSYPKGRFEQDTEKGIDKFIIGKMLMSDISFFYIKGEIDYSPTDDGTSVIFDTYDQGYYNLKIILWGTSVFFTLISILQFLKFYNADSSMIDEVKIGFILLLISVILLNIVIYYTLRYISKQVIAQFYESFKPDVLEINFSVTKFTLVLILKLIGVIVLFIIIWGSAWSYIINNFI